MPAAYHFRAVASDGKMRTGVLHADTEKAVASELRKQGLTPAEVSRMYGNVDSAALPAKTGSGVQPGNMGPGNQKGK